MSRTEPRKVAVVVVHGVADQRRGAPVEEVAVQLASFFETSHASSELELPVTPLAPYDQIYRRRRPEGLGGRLRKKLFQSLRSDFLDEQVGGQQAGLAPSSAHSDWADQGVRFTDYLLTKSFGARDERRAPKTESTSVACVAIPALVDPIEGGADGKNWRDACVGADAHTHYFDREQVCVARELARLIEERVGVAPAVAGGDGDRASRPSAAQ